MPGKPLKRRRTEEKLRRGETTRRELNGDDDDDVIVINRIVTEKPQRAESAVEDERAGVTESAELPEQPTHEEGAEVSEPEDVSNHPGRAVKTGPGGKRGASAEYMRALTRRRMEMAKTNPDVKGGRPRKPTRKEAEAAALDSMVPKALKILKDQLADPKLPPRERREVAKLVLEYKLGKPRQQIEQKIDQTISAIRFETAAFAGIPAADRALPDIELDGDGAD